MFFDHMVIFEKGNLNEKVTDLNAKDILASMGGRHENWGTENALLYFGLSYVEWLGIYDPDKAEMSDNPLVQRLCASPQGPGHFAIRTTDMDKLHEKLLSEGLQTIHLPGERKRADGKLLQWELLFVEEKKVYWPFFIQWKESDDSRLNDLHSTGWTGRNGAAHNRIEYIEIAVNDVVKTAERWSRMLSLPLLKCSETSAILQLEGGNIMLVKAAEKVIQGPRKAMLTSRQVID